MWGWVGPWAGPELLEKTNRFAPSKSEVLNFGSFNSPRIRAARYGEEHLVRESIAWYGGGGGEHMPYFRQPNAIQHKFQPQEGQQREC